MNSSLGLLIKELPDMVLPTHGLVMPVDSLWALKMINGLWVTCTILVARDMFFMTWLMRVEKTFVDWRLNLRNEKDVLKSLPEVKSFLKKPKSDCFWESQKVIVHVNTPEWQFINALVHSDLWSLRGWWWSWTGVEPPLCLGVGIIHIFHL